MGSEGASLKILFFPFMAQGHMLPMVDMAKLFASRGVQSTILTTPLNSLLIQPSISHHNSTYHHPIRLHVIPFPSLQAGLPPTSENFSSLSSIDSKDKFFLASTLLKDHFSRALVQVQPDCIVSDMFFPWTSRIAKRFNIPRIVFHGVSAFALSITHSIDRTSSNVADDDECIVVPRIPDRVEIKRSQVALSQETQLSPAMGDIVAHMKSVESDDYGTVVNSFHELEPRYADYVRNAARRRAWLVGPLCLREEPLGDRGDSSCLRWLGSRKPNSVAYVCFGSMAEFSAKQLRALALALESSGHDYIWVVRGGGREEQWDVKGRGMVIRGWAPQRRILNHEAVGGFVTHCGWNSCLEGISAGLPMVTWPMFGEQFYNERLIVDVLRVGVGVGAEEYGVDPERKAVVEEGRIREAVKEVMGREGEAVERRRRAERYGVLAKEAVGKGGSSCKDVNALIRELMDLRSVRMEMVKDGI